MPAVLPGALRFLLAATMIAVACADARAAENGWYTDFAEAQSRAARLNRPILVHFYAEWCAPCKRMDRDVLYVPAFLEALHRSVVPVKLDVSANEQLSRKYRVESVPTDLFLTPDGRVLGVMNGYREMADYLKRVAAIDRQYARQRDLYWARSDSEPPARKITGSDGPDFPELELPSADRRQPTSAQGELREPMNDLDPPGLFLKSPSDGTVLVGLKGYSPVSLYRERAWVKGDPQFAAEYQGLTYLMVNAAEQAEFRENAEKYAPQLLGCDPVLYFDEGRAFPGSTRLAVYYEDRLYLFSSAESRAAFRESPEVYSKRRTILLPEELESVLR